MHPGVVALPDQAVHPWRVRNLQLGGENTAYADHPHVDQRMWRMIAHVVQQGMARGTLAFNPGVMGFYSEEGQGRSPTPGGGVNWCGPDTAVSTPSCTVTGGRSPALARWLQAPLLCVCSLLVACSGAVPAQTAAHFEPHCVDGRLDMSADWETYCSRRMSADQSEVATRFILDLPAGCTNWLFVRGHCSFDWYMVMEILRAERGCASPAGTAACRVMCELRWSGALEEMYPTSAQGVEQREQFDLYCSCPEVMEMSSARRREARLRIEALEAEAPRPLESSGVEPGSE